MSKYAIYLSTLVILASAKHVPHAGNREGRWFGYRYTSTSIIPKMVTSLIPSSCVQIDASLPPCRNVRNLEEFPKFLSGYAREDVNHEIIPSIHTTKLGWGEYLGIYAPTVTVTAVEMRTTTMLDQRTVVTFSVKGCKPSRLPMDLSLCPSHTIPVIRDITPTVVADNIVGTTTMPDALTKPSLENVDAGVAEEVPNNLDLPTSKIQPATEQLIAVHPNNQMATEPLPLSMSSS